MDKCWGLKSCSQQYLYHHSHETPSASHPAWHHRGWNRTCLSSCPGTGGGAINWQTGKLLWLLAAKRSRSLQNFYRFPHTPSLQHLLPTPTKYSCKLDCSVSLLSFHATIRCHAALSCVLNSMAKFPTKICVHRAEEHYWNHPLLHFLLLKVSVTRITTCGLWQLQGIMEKA